VLCGDDEPPLQEATVTLRGDTGLASDNGSAASEVCPDGDDAEYLLDCWAYDIKLLAQEGERCTYEYRCSTCCGYGRPYLDESGGPVTSQTVSTRTGWSGEATPDDSALTHVERRVIIKHWLKNAQAEHSSVAGFHRFALDLLAYGAPPELLLRAQVAAGQEVRHAIDCFTLAGAYAGSNFSPAPMALGAQAPIAGSLAELAAWTARDGAIGETMAAHLAARALEQTRHPAVRRVLKRVVRDETAHAELAWATLQWALEIGGDAVAAVVREVFASITAPETRDEPWTPTLAAHGLLSPEEEVAAVRECIDEVLGPVVHSLLVAAAA